jgi:hypothetical protein
MAKTTKTATKKAAPKKKAEPKKIGHLNLTIFDNDGVSVEVNSPNHELIAALASIIASDDRAGELFRTAFAIAAGNLFDEDEKPKKAAPKKKAVVKKAAPKKKK